MVSVVAYSALLLMHIRTRSYVHMEYYCTYYCMIELDIYVVTYYTAFLYLQYLRRWLVPINFASFTLSSLRSTLTSGVIPLPHLEIEPLDSGHRCFDRIISTGCSVISSISFAPSPSPPIPPHCSCESLPKENCIPYRKGIVIPYGCREHFSGG